MLKKVGWLAKLIAAGLILSFLSIWTTGYIVTSYVETVLRQFNLPIEVPPMAMSGVWGKLWGSDPLTTADIADKEAENAAEQPVAIDAFNQNKEDPITGLGGGGGLQANGGADADTESIEEGTIAVDGTETAMTTDELAEVKDLMSDEDKEQLFGLLTDKLPQESWQSISQFVENGLTDQELSSVQQIMAQYLDKAEYEQMIDILKKY